MHTKKVVIIIPTYNEADVICETIEKVFAETKLIENHEIHILIFDSASTDTTVSLVKSLQATYPHLHLETEPQKSGLGSAYLKAMVHSLEKMQADIVFEFDADLSHQPKYLKPMLEKMKTYDVVIGSRYVQGGSIPKDWGIDRKFLSYLGNFTARALLHPKYKDFTSGFRATSKEALKNALPSQFLSNHYAYKIELFWALHRNKASIYEHPIAFVDRKKGFSKLPANSILDSLKVLFSLRFRYRR